MSGTQVRSLGSAETVAIRRLADDIEPVVSFRDRAIQLSLQGRFVESEACSRQALRLRPDNMDVLNELIVAVWRQGRAEEAEQICRDVCRLNPDDFRILTGLGLALMDQGRMDEAAESFRAALRIQPDAFHARMNLGVVLSNQGDFEAAMDALWEAFELCTDSPNALQNIGMNLARVGRLNEAIVFYEHALQLRPEFPEVHRNLAYALLQGGDYQRGWPELEWRWKCKPHPGCRINRTFWNGDQFRDQTILLHFEQGYGDTLQFIRYAPLVKQRGGRVAVLCQPALRRLIARCEGIDQVVDGTGDEPDCHIQAPLMSLPAIFGTTLATIPARVPYLNADPVLVEHWRSVLARVLGTGSKTGSGIGGGSGPGLGDRPFLIGIAWQGRPENAGDHWRSFPLARFAHLAELPGVRLISLQVDHGTEQISALGDRFPVIELPGLRGGDFSDTAALIRLLDLVISPCTAVAHLAGGLGARVWVPLSYVGDWRWLARREDSPWYPSLRLFRQTRIGDWEPVFRRMAQALVPELESRAGSLSPP
jgi:Flp pilus assembly protein TadD